MNITNIIANQILTACYKSTKYEYINMLLRVTLTSNYIFNLKIYNVNLDQNLRMYLYNL